MTHEVVKVEPREGRKIYVEVKIDGYPDTRYGIAYSKEAAIAKAIKGYAQ